MIKVLIFLYCAWLMVCYNFLTFSAWDSLPNWLYYMWEKSFGVGFVMWLVLYINVKKERPSLAPVVWFSVLRFGLDVFGFFTGITASSEPRIAVLFLALIAVFYVLTLRKHNICDKWLRKLLFN